MRRHSQLISCAVVALTTALAAAPQAIGQLTHRWSFDSDATDSVGSSDWTVNGATFSGGEVVFDGVDDYLELTSTPLPTASGSSTTIEVWGTYDPSTPEGSRIFDFSTANGDIYMFLSPNRQALGPDANPSTSVGWDDDFDVEFGPTTSSDGQSNTGEEVLLTLVVDSAAPTSGSASVLGEFRLYRNGVQIASQENVDSFLNDLLLNILAGADASRLGHGVSLYDSAAELPSAPAFLNGSINEMRIYSNALDDEAVLVNAISGPDTTSVVLSGQSWTAGSGDWAAGANWGGAVPGGGERAVIDNGGEATVSSAVADAGGLDLGGSTLSVGAGGDLNVLYPVHAGVDSTINVTGGGRLGLSAVISDEAEGARTVNVDGGALAAPGGALVIDERVTLNVGPGGATLGSDGAQISLSGALTGDGEIAVSGASIQVDAPGDVVDLLQNPDFAGSWRFEDSTVNIRGSQGALGTGGERSGATVALIDSTLQIDTGGGKEVPIDLHVEGDSQIVNFASFNNTFRLEGSVTGDGVVRYTVPLSPEAIGIDFQNRTDSVDPAVDSATTDNSGFTGRFVVADDTAVRFFSFAVTDEEGTVIDNERLSDFPNAIFELDHAGAWVGKRRTDPVEVIQLGGMAGIAGSRFEAFIAGDGEASDAPNTTYEVGGAAEDAEYFGTVRDSPRAAGGVDVTSVVKVGDNTQAFSGANTYSGATTVNGGLLLINGTHSQAVVTGDESPTDYAGDPVGDYTVNAGGTLGGDGVIGSGTDNVDVDVLGGTLNPGSEVGTLTVNGNVSFGEGSIFLAEVLGAAADKLIVSGTLDLGANETLDVSLLGSVTPGDYVIAEYGSLVGTFDSVPSGYSVDYTGGMITVSVTDAGILPGDYNADGVVDAADYTVYRDNAGTSNALPNDAIGGFIGSDHYDQWADNFGATAPSFSGAVPEPAAASLALLLLGAASCGSRRNG